MRSISAILIVVSILLVTYPLERQAPPAPPPLRAETTTLNWFDNETGRTELLIDGDDQTHFLDIPPGREVLDASVRISTRDPVSNPVIDIGADGFEDWSFPGTFGATTTFPDRKTSTSFENGTHGLARVPLGAEVQSGEVLVDGEVEEMNFISNQYMRHPMIYDDILYVIANSQILRFQLPEFTSLPAISVLDGLDSLVWMEELTVADGVLFVLDNTWGMQVFDLDRWEPRGRTLEAEWFQAIGAWDNTVYIRTVRDLFIHQPRDNSTEKIAVCGPHPDGGSSLVVNEFGVFLSCSGILKMFDHRGNHISTWTLSSENWIRDGDILYGMTETSVVRLRLSTGTTLPSIPHPVIQLRDSTISAGILYHVNTSVPYQTHINRYDLEQSVVLEPVRSGESIGGLLPYGDGVLQVGSWFVLIERDGSSTAIPAYSLTEYSQYSAGMWFTMHHGDRALTRWDPDNMKVEVLYRPYEQELIGGWGAWEGHSIFWNATGLHVVPPGSTDPELTPLDVPAVVNNELYWLYIEHDWLTLRREDDQHRFYDLRTMTEMVNWSAVSGQGYHYLVDVIDGVLYIARNPEDGPRELLRYNLNSGDFLSPLEPVGWVRSVSTYDDYVFVVTWHMSGSGSRTWARITVYNRTSGQEAFEFPYGPESAGSNYRSAAGLGILDGVAYVPTNFGALWRLDLESMNFLETIDGLPRSRAGSAVFFIDDVAQIQITDGWYRFDTVSERVLPAQVFSHHLVGSADFGGATFELGDWDPVVVQGSVGDHFSWSPPRQIWDRALKIADVVSEDGIEWAELTMDLAIDSGGPVRMFEPELIWGMTMEVGPSSMSPGCGEGLAAVLNCLLDGSSTGRIPISVQGSRWGSIVLHDLVIVLGPGDLVQSEPDREEEDDIEDASVESEEVRENATQDDRTPDPSDGMAKPEEPAILDLAQLVDAPLEIAEPRSSSPVDGLVLLLAVVVGAEMVLLARIWLRRRRKFRH